MSLDGFESLAGRRIARNIEVMRLIGRNPVRYECFCHICCSSWAESHTKLVNEGAGYKCRNVACALGRVKPRPPEPPTEKPEPGPVPVTVEKWSKDYDLYRSYMESHGYGPSDIGSVAEWNRLDNDLKARLLAPAIDAEKAAIKKQELDAFGRAFEAMEDLRFRKQHGNY